jgi:TPR repeat protein
MENAMKWFQRAANQGNEQAAKNVRVLRKQGF